MKVIEALTWLTQKSVELTEDQVRLFNQEDVKRLAKAEWTGIAQETCQTCSILASVWLIFEFEAWPFLVLFVSMCKVK